MHEQQPKHTIYLDFDGVIFPYWHKSDSGYVQTEQDNPLRSRSEIQNNLEECWIDRHEFYYPAITRRLGSIAARGAHIIPSSSRSLDLFLHYPSIREDLGSVDRFLSIDTFNPVNISHKAEAVLKNWQGVIDLSNERRGWERQQSLRLDYPQAKPPGNRAVWIDDHATQQALKISPSEYTRDTLLDPSLKILSPLGKIGLTMSHLDDIESFLFESRVHP